MFSAFAAHVRHQVVFFVVAVASLEVFPGGVIVGAADIVIAGVSSDGVCDIALVGLLLDAVAYIDIIFGIGVGGVIRGSSGIGRGRRRMVGCVLSCVDVYISRMSGHSPPLSGELRGLLLVGG